MAVAEYVGYVNEADKELLLSVIDDAMKPERESAKDMKILLQARSLLINEVIKAYEIAIGEV